MKFNEFRKQVADECRERGFQMAGKFAEDLGYEGEFLIPNLHWWFKVAEQETKTEEYQKCVKFAAKEMAAQLWISYEVK